MQRGFSQAGSGKLAAAAATAAALGAGGRWCISAAPSRRVPAILFYGGVPRSCWPVQCRAAG